MRWWWREWAPEGGACAVEARNPPAGSPLLPCSSSSSSSSSTIGLQTDTRTHRSTRQTRQRASHTLHRPSPRHTARAHPGSPLRTRTRARDETRNRHLLLLTRVREPRHLRALRSRGRRSRPIAPASPTSAARACLSPPRACVRARAASPRAAAAARASASERASAAKPEWTFSWA